jgi:hypothetical protein
MMQSGKHPFAGGAGLLVIFLLILAACSMGFGGPGESPDGSPPGGDPGPGLPRTADKPAGGEMSAGTAAKILRYESRGGKVYIDSLLDLAALEKYLNPAPESRQAAGTTVKTWIIKTIGGEPVAGIASGAFALSGPLISSVVNTIKLPETITNLGESLFAAGDALVLDIPRTASLNDDALVKAAAGSNGVTVQTSNPDNPAEAPVLVVIGPPVLLRGPDIDYTDGARATYTFNTAVTVSGFDNSRWSVIDPADPLPAATVKVKYTGADEEPVHLSLRAEAAHNGVSKSTDIPPVEVMPVRAALERPSPAREYTLVYYEAEQNVVRLRAKDSPSTSWYSVKEADNDLRDLFEGIYRPNAPATTDAVEAGKQAFPYTPDISRTVLDLFKITLDAASPNAVNITGALPAAAGADKYHPIVIDIGVPDKDNRGFPVFKIPDREFITTETDYAHIRFRVNRGMELEIADGSGPGNVTNGTVEVMGNSRLWDTAYEGFLGTGAVVIVRLGGYLRAGPRSLFESQDYSDWLIAPVMEGGKISWGTGDQNGSYIEFRQDGRMAFSADITIRKSLALKYDVWFVNGPILTLDAAGDNSTINGRRGLFAGGPQYRFYGNYFNSGGQNPSRVEAKIVVLSGNDISRSLLAGGEGYISGPAGIPNAGAGNSAPVEYGRDSIKGYPNWNTP